MKYYSIHFNSVGQLKSVMGNVFNFIDGDGIYRVNAFKNDEYRYDLVIGDELTFVCVIRTGIGYLPGIKLLGSYSIIRGININEDSKRVYDWIMDKCKQNFRCDTSTGAANFFIYPQIKKVIFNDPATIVFWSDGSKTVVKAQNGEVYDQEKGLAMAITKKWFGNKGNYYNNIKKWLPKDI